MDSDNGKENGNYSIRIGFIVGYMVVSQNKGIPI